MSKLAAAKCRNLPERQRQILPERPAGLHRQISPQRLAKSQRQIPPVRRESTEPRADTRQRQNHCPPGFAWIDERSTPSPPAQRGDRARSVRPVPCREPRPPESASNVRCGRPRWPGTAALACVQASRNVAPAPSSLPANSSEDLHLLGRFGSRRSCCTALATERLVHHPA